MSVSRRQTAELLAALPELYPRLLVGMAARIRAIDRHSDLIA